MIHSKCVEQTHENVNDLIINLRWRIECLERQLANSGASSASKPHSLTLTDAELKMLNEQF